MAAAILAASTTGYMVHSMNGNLITALFLSALLTCPLAYRWANKVSQTPASATTPPTNPSDKPYQKKQSPSGDMATVAAHTSNNDASNKVTGQLSQTNAIDTFGPHGLQIQEIQAILDGIRSGIVVMDTGGRIELTNYAATQILSLQKQDIGKTLLEATHIPELSEVVTKTREGNPTTQEFVLPGSKKVITATSNLLPNSGMIVVVEDVTLVRNLERIRRDFVANVSHELRTPVSVIFANAETLVTHAQDDEWIRPKMIDGIYRNAERLSLLVNDLLQIFTLEDGKIISHPETVLVIDAAQRVSTLLIDELERNKISVQWDMDPNHRAFVDKKALEQILHNYLENSIKHAPPNSQITMASIRKPGQQIEIQVQDCGIGVPKKHQQRIFERFYRADNSRSLQKGGTGLGLSIVKHLAEMNGGKVGYCDRPGGGSIFYLQVPEKPPTPS